MKTHQFQGNDSISKSFQLLNSNKFVNDIRFVNYKIFHQKSVINERIILVFKQKPLQQNAPKIPVNHFNINRRDSVGNYLQICMIYNVDIKIRWIILNIKISKIIMQFCHSDSEKIFTRTIANSSCPMQTQGRDEDLVRVYGLLSLPATKGHQLPTNV